MPKVTVEGLGTRRSRSGQAAGARARARGRRRPAPRLRRQRPLHDLPRRVRRRRAGPDDRGREAACWRPAGLTGVRLSCQIVCDHDMTVRVISRLAGSGRADAGNRGPDHHAPAGVDPERELSSNDSHPSNSITGWAAALRTWDPLSDRWNQVVVEGVFEVVARREAPVFAGGAVVDVGGPVR